MQHTTHPEPMARHMCPHSDLLMCLISLHIWLVETSTFDNQPENDLSWKAGFDNTIEGLNLKPREQLELLIKWLGGESLQHA